MSNSNRPVISNSSNRGLASAKDPSKRSVSKNVVKTGGKTAKVAADGHDEEHKLSIFIASMFVLGEMAGGGVIQLPAAMLKTGWTGLIPLVLSAALCCYTGTQLGWCWCILQENWPDEYKKQSRKPYAEIGYRAGGKAMKYAVQICVDFTSFGVSVAFLVLSAKNLSGIIDHWFKYQLNYCWLILIIALCLYPFTFLGTPKDFWPIAVGAIGGTSLAVFLIIVGTIIDASTCYPKVSYHAPTFVSFVGAMGIMVFAYSGHPAFSTIQHDMQDPSRFPHSLLIGYGILFLMYVPMAVFAFAVYGDNVQEPIYDTFSAISLSDICVLLVTCHVLFAFYIFFNPISQDLEEMLGIPKHFTWKRVCTRTALLATILFVALTIPDFGALLELIGGTLMSAISVIFPGPFYLLLRKRTKSPAAPKSGNKMEMAKTFLFDHRSIYGSNIAIWEWIVNGVIVAFGVFLGIASVYAVGVRFTALDPPCYAVGMYGTKKEKNETILCWNANYSGEEHPYTQPQAFWYD